MCLTDFRFQICGTLQKFDLDPSLIPLFASISEWPRPSFISTLRSAGKLVGCDVSQRRVYPVLIVVCKRLGYDHFGILEACKFMRPDVLLLECPVKGFHMTVLFRCGLDRASGHGCRVEDVRHPPSGVDIQDVEAITPPVDAAVDVGDVGLPDWLGPDGLNHLRLEARIIFFLLFCDSIQPIFREIRCTFLRFVDTPALWIPVLPSGGSRPWRNVSFQSWKVADDTLCLRHNSAADMVVKNSVTILAFSCGLRFLLMFFL